MIMYRYTFPIISNKFIFAQAVYQLNREYVTTGRYILETSDWADEEQLPGVSNGNLPVQCHNPTDYSTWIG